MAKTDTEHKLATFAEDLGRLLGTTQNKAEAWLRQRKDIAAQLTKVRDTANQLLEQLGGDVPWPFGRKRGAKRAAKRGGNPGRRRLSVAARKAISEAQKRRWAAAKRVAAGKGSRKGKTAE